MFVCLFCFDCFFVVVLGGGLREGAAALNVSKHNLKKMSMFTSLMHLLIFMRMFGES